jgi:hypothetical protein
VSENRVLRRIFGPKTDEMTGEWRKMHKEELHDLYSSPSIIRIMNLRKMRWAGHVARMERGGTCIGRPRHMSLDNIRMDLVEVG